MLAPPPKYKENLVAGYETHRWGAELIAFVSRPAKDEHGNLYTHILLVQDIVSRYLYGRALKAVSQTETAFVDMFDESENRMSNADYTTPAALKTGAGPERTSKQLQSLMKRRFRKHRIKPKDCFNAMPRPSSTSKRRLNAGPTFLAPVG